MKAPFQQNYTKSQEEDEEEMVEANHFFQEDELPTFLTEEDQFSRDSFIPDDQQFVLSSDDLWADRTEEHQRGYHNALNHLQKQYNLRNINVLVTIIQKRKNLQKDTPSKESPPTCENKDKAIITQNRDRTNEASTRNVRKDKEMQTQSQKKETQAKG